MERQDVRGMPKALLPLMLCARGVVFACCLLLCSVSMVFYNGFSEHVFLRIFSCRYGNEVEIWIKHRRSFHSTISVHRRIQGNSKVSQNPLRTGAVL